MTTIIENFRNYLLQLGYSRSSCKALPKYVKAFLEHHHITAQETITPKHIEIFYNWLQIRPLKHGTGGLSENYIYHHVYALKLFFSYLEQTGQITCNPISAMKFKRPQTGIREPLTKAEINQLFDTAVVLKETAMLHLFYSCGLRRSEAAALNIRDIHFRSCLLYVRAGKNAKRRAIPMTAKVAKDLESYYLQERVSGICPEADTEAFVLNRYGKRMSCGAYNKFMRTFVFKSGIKRLVTPHYLRHSIATHLLENGLSLEYVKEFLGHSFLESTQIYTKVSKYQLKRL